MKLDAMRPGQKLALSAIKQRLIEGERYTAIVLPTRYGKSDVIRVAALDLWRSCKICCALALSPNAILRDQLVTKEKFDAMLARYQIKQAGLKVKKLLKLEVRPTANGEFFLSSTTQLVDRNTEVFAQWVESMTHKTGLPVMVFVDECHTGSEDNSWGQTVARLVDAGAFAVLMTATAERSDGRLIPGFEAEVLNESPATIYKTRPGESDDKIKVEVYQGVKRFVRLKAHHETTFREAWAEIPSPLCKIGRVPFDVALREVFGGDFGDKRLLSELTPTQARESLGKIVRDGHVIREGAKRLVDALAAFRRMEPSCAAMVFCGNDDDPVKRVNDHANLIKAAIASIDASLKVVIATSSDGNDGADGKTLIERFASDEKQEGDVLIVKQMASVGLDGPRIKAALDLSPVRTPAAFTQRLMRIATLFKFIKHGVYISPDDVLGRTLFSQLVSENGGTPSVSDLELVDQYPKDRSDSPEKTTYLVSGTELADFEDSEQNQAEKARLAEVNFILGKFPELNAFLSHAEIANRLVDTGLMVPESVQDTADAAENLRGDINQIVHEVVKAKRRSLGLTYSPQEYGEMVREAFNEVYQTAGVSVSSLSDITELAVLERIKAAAERYGELSEAV